MITIHNYFKEIKDLDVLNFPAGLRDGYIFTEEATENHKSWNFYKSDKDVKETIDEYLDQLNKYIEKNKSEETGKHRFTESDGREAAKKLIYGYVERGDSEQSLKAGQMGHGSSEFDASIKGNKIFVTEILNKKVNFSFPLHSIYNEIKEELDKQGSNSSSKKNEEKEEKREDNKPIRIDMSEAKPVEKISEEVKIIRRFVRLHGKQKTIDQILSFFNSVKRAAIERRIRITSKYSKEIMLIQRVLKRIYDNMGDSEKITLDQNLLNKLVTVSGSEKVRLSINFMKRYVGIQGKNITKEKAKKFYNLIADAINKGKIKKSDPYFNQIMKVLEGILQFIKVAKNDEKLSIHESVLSGINTSLGCGCDSGAGNDLAGIPETEPKIDTRNKVMNSVDFSDLKFDTLGFMGKWREYIGDPSPGFYAMVSGRPKYGKSSHCIEFAGYLARHHGNVLYVAKEEKLDFTLQKKLNEIGVKHPNLYVSDHLPEDLSKYDYIFLDSVNKLNLTPKDINRLQEQNPGKNFIAIYQTRKDGVFRGSNEGAHDPDIIIDFPERGKAIQYGRFNQGGEMDIFKNDSNA